MQNPNLGSEDKMKLFKKVRNNFITINLCDLFRAKKYSGCSKSRKTSRSDNKNELATQQYKNQVDGMVGTTYIKRKEIMKMVERWLDKLSAIGDKQTLGRTYL